MTRKVIALLMAVMTLVGFPKPASANPSLIQAANDPQAVYQALSAARTKLEEAARVTPAAFDRNDSTKADKFTPDTILPVQTLEQIQQMSGWERATSLVIADECQVACVMKPDVPPMNRADTLRRQLAGFVANCARPGRPITDSVYGTKATQQLAAGAAAARQAREATTPPPTDTSLDHQREVAQQQALAEKDRQIAELQQTLARRSRVATTKPKVTYVDNPVAQQENRQLRAENHWLLQNVTRLQQTVRRERRSKVQPSSVAMTANTRAMVATITTLIHRNRALAADNQQLLRGNNQLVQAVRSLRAQLHDQATTTPSTSHSSSTTTTQTTSSNQWWLVDTLSAAIVVLLVGCGALGFLLRKSHQQITAVRVRHAQEIEQLNSRTTPEQHFTDWFIAQFASLFDDISLIYYHVTGERTRRSSSGVRNPENQLTLLRVLVSDTTARIEEGGTRLYVQQHLKDALRTTFMTIYPQLSNEPLPDDPALMLPSQWMPLLQRFLSQLPQTIDQRIQTHLASVRERLELTDDRVNALRDFGPYAEALKSYHKTHKLAAQALEWLLQGLLFDNPRKLNSDEVGLIRRSLSCQTIETTTGPIELRKLIVKNR